MRAIAAIAATAQQQRCVGQAGQAGQAADGAALRMRIHYRLYYVTAGTGQPGQPGRATGTNKKAKSTPCVGVAKWKRGRAPSAVRQPSSAAP